MNRNARKQTGTETIEIENRGWYETLNGYRVGSVAS